MSTTHMLPPPPTPPPPPLPGSPLPRPPPPAPLLPTETISGFGALAGVFPQMKGDLSVVTGQLSCLMDQSRGKLLPERRSREMTSSDPAPSPRSLGVPDPGTWRQGGEGGVVKLGLHVVLHTLNQCQRAGEYTRPLGCDLNSKSFFHILKRFQ